MPRTARVLWLLAYAACAAAAVQSLAAAPEYNPVRRSPIAIGPEAKRLIVGMRATPTNAVSKTIVVARRARSYTVTQAQTTSADVKALVQRVGLSLAKSRQFTPSMHILFLQKTLYGADVEAALEKLRADPAVQFAAVDHLRYPLVVPTNPLFLPTPGTASGQWYMNTPGPATVEGVATQDASATDAVSAWGITTGSAGVVIADVDSGILFNHPDLLRAGLGGRLLPGYDFVGQDYDATTGAALGTYLRANDGDGWDPDPSDPGDWINSADQQNPLFPASRCTADNSTWHGTRVVGVYGAITNNDAGTAGMTWGSPTSPGPWVLPVRALGKCGGYDSDIIAGIQWAAGLPVTNPEGPAVPANPYPADIINLSIGGGTDSCSSANGAPYQSAFTTVTAMDILIVISAGNGGMPGQTAPVELPGNCSAIVPGVIAVAGLRNVGTKVGYSSFGPEVTVSAPAGNCINSSGACLRSIDTTTNAGLTVPTANGYTNETNPNLGTSFSAPIVSGIAGLMRSVNGNLTPTQLTARLKSSATKPFPTGAAGLPTCPSNDPTTGECACPNDGSQCGAGMVNAYHAVQAAQLPIAAVKLPPIVAGSDAVLDASGSGASCGRSITKYSWTASGGVSIVSGGSSDKATILPGAGTVTLTVTDNMNGTDTATIAVTSNSASSSAPASAGNTACPTALQVTPVPPTVAQAFAPASVGKTIPSILTFTLRNANAFTLTQSNFSDTLPVGMMIANSSAPASTCTGANGALTNTSTSIALTGANIPPNGSCTVTMSVSSAAAGSYTNVIAANALMTGPAGGNAAASQAMLTVTVPKPPTVSEAFAPASVGQNGNSTLTITLGNSNAYALTSVGLNATLPGNLTVKSSPTAASSCGGTMSAPMSSVTLSGATIPANGSCTLTLTVSSATVGTYANSIAASAVTSTPAGGNTAPASATLTVTASSGGGGGALQWPDLLALAGALLMARGRSRSVSVARR
jgi:serine protease